MHAPRWMLSVAALCALAACSPRPWPTCFPEGDASVPHGAGETAALADARRRSPECGHESRQCRFVVDTDAAGRIGVHLFVELADRADRKCGVPTDFDRHYRYSATGVFESEFRR